MGESLESTASGGRKGNRSSEEGSGTATDVVKGIPGQKQPHGQRDRSKSGGYLQETMVEVSIQWTDFKFHPSIYPSIHPSIHP